MKHFFRQLLILASTMTPFIVLAQSDLYKDVSIASPSAAALHKYGDYPVSYHTGTPNISIPLYSVSYGPLSLPVSLSYNASGLKVAEISSWVGSGWSLTAGGVISRTVRGIPDERGTGSAAGIKGFMSDKGYSSYLTYNYNGSTVNSNASQFLSGQLDGEPDIFHFNVGGASGKFFINDAGNVVLMPMQDVSISYDYSGTGSISSFTIIVSNGTKYQFGRTAINNDVDPVEITKVASSESGTAMGNVISSWYLNKITSHDGVFSIDLKYQAESYSYYSITNPTMAENDTYDKDYTYIKSVVSGVRLSSIEHPNGKVNFLANHLRLDLGSSSPFFGTDDFNTQANALSEIEVRNEINVIQKRIVFEYGYFEDNVSTLPVYSIYTTLKTDKKRLKLLSLQEFGSDNSSEPKTQFTYFSDFVPRRLSLSVDHWGYFNAKPNLRMIPTYTRNNYQVVVPGANREPSWPEMRAGTIQKITYPTGGASEFEFEPHRFNAYIPQNTEVEIGRVSQGYDGNSSAKEFTATINSGASFGARVINTPQPSNSNGNASLTIYKPDNTVFATITASPGAIAQQSFVAPAQGLYRFVLQKLYVTTGNGAEAIAFTNSTGQALADQMIGGLRVKKMQLKEPYTESAITTEFEYQDNGVSSGILYGRPTYVHVVRNDELKTFGWFTLPNNQTTFNASPNGCLNLETNSGNDNQYSFKSAVSIRPMEVSQGSHIGYTTVTVKKVGNGKTVYKFFGAEPWNVNRADIVNRNLNNGSCDINVPSYPFIPLKEDYRRGVVKSEWVFNEAGTWLTAKNYELEYTESIEGTPCLIVSSASAGGFSSLFSSGTGTSSSAMLGSFYLLKTAKKTHYKETTVLYPATANPFISESTSFYESPYHSQQTKLLSYDSKGVQKQNIVKYSADFQNTYIAALDNGESTYVSAAQTAWINAQVAVGSCTSNACKWNALHLYRSSLITARQQYLSVRASNFTNTNSSYNTLFNNYYNSASSILKPLMQLQKNKMLFPVEGREVIGDKVVKSYFNEFVISSEVADRVYPFKLYTLKEGKLSSQFSIASHDNYTISKDNGYELESTSSYTNGNLTEYTGRNGVTNAYLWGYNNAFPIAKAVGVSYSILKNAYTNNNNVLPTLFAQASLSQALVNTYQYSPFFGITKQTDQKGNNIYYDYDPWGRLMQTKDHRGNVIKKYCYNYAGQVVNCFGQQFSNNVDWSLNFTKNDCSIGQTGSTVLFPVPIGTIFSNISVTDANTKAYQKAIDEGQAYANANGSCSVQPTTIYAVLTVENLSVSGISTFGDVVIRFYSDAAHTQPVNVNNLYIKVQRHVTDNFYGFGNTDYLFAYANGDSYVLLSGEELSSNDGWSTDWWKNFILEQENGYIVN